MSSLSEVQAFAIAHWTAVLSAARDNEPHACTIYYVTDGNKFFFKSQSNAQHSIILKQNALATLVIYEHESTYEEKKGVQIAGTVERIQSHEELQQVFTLFAGHPDLVGVSKKMSDLNEFIGETKAGFYAFVPTKAKIVDTMDGKNEYSDWIEWI